MAQKSSPGSKRRRLVDRFPPGRPQVARPPGCSAVELIKLAELSAKVRGKLNARARLDAATVNAAAMARRRALRVKWEQEQGYVAPVLAPGSGITEDGDELLRELEARELEREGNDRDLFDLVRFGSKGRPAR